jgi:hypothetical protein
MMFICRKHVVVTFVLERIRDLSIELKDSIFRMS